MSDTLTATKRDACGSLASRKLRAAGSVPAVLYGHKEAAESLAVSERELRKALAHKAKVVQLAGDASGQAIVQAVQWDTFHRELLHLDLLRVSKGEKVHTTVPVELRGVARGAEEGGVVSAVHDHVEVEATPANIPEVLYVDVSGLGIGESATVADLSEVPDGCTVLTPPERVLANCSPPASEPELDDVAAPAESPEVISSGKPEDESDDSGGESDESKEDGAKQGE